MNGVNNYTYVETNNIGELESSRSTITITKPNILKEKKLEKTIKRTIDIVGGIIGTIALLPLTIVIYIANLIYNDNGPLFFLQERIGKDGKTFKMYKYRSMVIGADEILFEYLKENEEAREEYSKYKKLKKDPRTTIIGKFIRKTSIDEFPQFINVIKGEMSLVGPRPYLPREKEDMGEYYTYITELKPGLTGYWQIAGRSDVTFEDRLKMDMKYINDRSLKLDCILLLKTGIKVFKRGGAI